MVFDYIEAFYNSHRQHSAIDYHSPMSYEKTHDHQEQTLLPGRRPLAAV